jgi:hypothetical protein
MSHVPGLHYIFLFRQSKSCSHILRFIYSSIWTTFVHPLDDQAVSCWNECCCDSSCNTDVWNHVSSSPACPLRWAIAGSHENLLSTRGTAWCSLGWQHQILAQTNSATPTALLHCVGPLFSHSSLLLAVVHPKHCSVLVTRYVMSKQLACPSHVLANQKHCT